MRAWLHKKILPVECFRAWALFTLSRYSRKLAASGNRQRILLNRNEISGPPRIAVDTTVYQIFGKTIVSDEVHWKSWRERDTFSRRITPKYDSKSLAKNTEMKYAFAVCEAFRRGELHPILLESIAREMAHAGDIHLGRYHGPNRLDYDVDYEVFDFFDLVHQAKEIFRRANIGPEKISESSINIDSKYLDLIRHLQGKAHQKDLIHLIACDIGNIDVFLTLDGKLTRAFENYRNRKHVYKLGVKLLSPSDFCKTLKMAPIEIPTW